MKSFLIFSWLILVLIYSSCSQTTGYEKINVKPAAILKDFKSWWNYTSTNIHLSLDFTAFDTASNIISKVSFLQLLRSGNYIPLQLSSKDSSLHYQLYNISSSVDNDVHKTIKELAEVGYTHYMMEGKELPGFNFTNLEGEVYNKETFKGKIVVLKCWFIHCQRCIEEMPALNELISHYKNRKDILFISLAFDSKEELKKFLANRTFNYTVVPDQQFYLKTKLKITSYPTHLVINKAGLISKVVDDEKELAMALKNEALQ